MRDLKHLIYFESLLENADNDLVKQAQAEGKLAIGYTCYHMPEPLLNLPGCFSVRLRAPRTGSLDIATYYMSNYTCEYARALVERGMEGGYQFLDALAGVDACSMMNRAMEHFEILQMNDKPNFFVTHCDIPYKITDYTLDSYVKQMRRRVLEPLAEKYGARVMVDDAHGLGVLGEGGRGTASYFGLEDKVDVYMGTFSKSLASLGGYMAASKAVTEYVRHASRPFIFSASIPPANCATALAALCKLEAHPELPERLRELSLYARKGFTERGLKIRESALNAPTPIIPIYTYETMRTLDAAQKIYERGVYVNPTLPPATPEGEALLRTSYMATHTEALLDEAMDIMAEVLLHEQ